jgi:hypothetical protein
MGISTSLLIGPELEAAMKAMATETYNDASGCATGPRTPNANVSLTSGNVYGCRAVCTKEQPYTKIRFYAVAAGGETPTKLVFGIWTAAGTTLLAETADFSASYLINKKLEVALTAPFTPTLGQELMLGVASVSATALQFRGFSNIATILGISPAMARSATGYTTGGPPASCGASGSTTTSILFELVP